MTRLSVYVVRQLMPGIAWVWVFLLAVDLTFAVFGNLADGDSRLFARQVALGVPARAYRLFPMACLIGGLWRMGDLAAYRELVAARSAGLAPVRFALWALAAGVALSLPALWLGEGVAPAAGYRAQLLRAGSERPDLGVERSRELWVRDGPRMIHIGAVEAPQLLSDVQVLEFDPDRRLKQISAARAARYDGGRWYLEDVGQTVFGDGRVIGRHSTRTVWDHPPDPALVQALMRAPEQMSLTDLRRYLGYLKANDLATGRYALSFWTRLAWPVTTWVMLLLGLALVLLPARPWRTATRLLSGVLIGLGFRLLSDTLAQAGLVCGLPPAAAAWLPTSLAVILVAVLLRRAR